MFTTEFIADVLTAEIQREADYRAKPIAINAEALAEAVERIEAQFAKFRRNTNWSYATSEDIEQAESDRLTTLLDSAVTLYFA